MSTTHIISMVLVIGSGCIVGWNCGRLPWRSFAMVMVGLIVFGVGIHMQGLP